MATPSAQRYAASFAAFSVFVLLTVTLGFACAATTKPAAGLEVIISTMDLRTPQDFDWLSVTVTQETGNGVFSPRFDNLRRVPSEVSLPTSVSIAAGSNPDQLARIVVRALKGTTIVVERIAEVQIPTSSLLELDIDLASDCLNMLCRATANATCVGGMCQTVTVTPATQLRPYQGGDMGGASSGGAGDATVGGSDASAPPGDGTATSACAAQCVLSGGCFDPGGGTNCCISKGAACPFGGMCNGGVCGPGSADSGVPLIDSGGPGFCGQPNQPCCMTGGPPCAPDACMNMMGAGTCMCAGPGGACGAPGAKGTCNAGICSGGSTGPCQGCSGCCDGTGACQPGTTASACGIGGTGCMTCASGSTCNGGGCMAQPCGMTGQACCAGGGGSGGCYAQATCSNGTCVACGGAGMNCCGPAPGNCNGANLFCSGNTCVACGGLNQQCCNGGCPSSGLMCSGGTCVQACGGTGQPCCAGNVCNGSLCQAGTCVACGQGSQPCCPYNQCNPGCCENGTCTAQGATCSVYGGTCANQGCQGNTCGAGGQACCTAPDGGLGCTNGNDVCRNGTCQMCGMPGTGAYSNCCPGDVCMSGGVVCSHAADAGSGGNPDAGYCIFCGGYKAPCCSGSGSGPNSPCQTGYTCTAGVCQ